MKLLSKPHKLHREESFPYVSNLQHSRLNPIQRDHFDINHNGYFLNYQMNLFSIVHQYDRDINLQTTYSKQFINWIDFNKPFEEFDIDPTCANDYKYLSGVDLFKGKCDLNSYRAITFASCCAVCTNHKKSCTAFTFVDGICFFKKCSISEINSLVTNKDTSSYNMKNAISAYLKQ